MIIFICKDSHYGIWSGFEVDLVFAVRREPARQSANENAGRRESARRTANENTGRRESAR